MDTIMELIQQGLKDLIPKDILIAGATWGILHGIILLQVLIIVSQTAGIISEIIQPQYIKRFRRTKLADIILSASLSVLAIIIILAICYLSSMTAKPVR